MTTLRIRTGRKICIAMATIVSLFASFSFAPLALAHGPHNFYNHHQPPSSPSDPPPDPPTPVNLLNYGGVGDGVTDNQKAFSQAIAAAGTGGSVFVPAGIYDHSGPIVLNGVVLFGAGPSTIVVATNSSPKTGGAIELEGFNAGVNSMVIKYNGSFCSHCSQTPDPNPLTAGIYVNNASIFNIVQVNITNTPGNGIDVNTSYYGVITSNLITNTGGDGILQWDSNRMYIQNNAFQNAGCREIELTYSKTGNNGAVITGNQIQSNSYRRSGGAFLSGVMNVAFNGNGIINGDIAVVGGPANSHGIGPVFNVQVEANTIDSTGETCSAAIVVQDTEETVNPKNFDNVYLQYNTITNSATEAIYAYGSDLEILGNLITNTRRDGIDIGSSQNVSCTMNALSKVYGNGIRVNAFSGNGSVTVSGNTFANLSTGPKKRNFDVVRVDNNSGKYTTLTVTGNAFNGGPTTTNSKNFIEVLVPSASVVPGPRNTSTPANLPGASLLPNNIVP
jgi:hypothetical protein